MTVNKISLIPLPWVYFRYDHHHNLINLLKSVFVIQIIELFIKIKRRVTHDFLLPPKTHTLFFISKYPLSFAHTHWVCTVFCKHELKYKLQGYFQIMINYLHLLVCEFVFICCLHEPIIIVFQKFVNVIRIRHFLFEFD